MHLLQQYRRHLYAGAHNRNVRERTDANNLSEVASNHSHAGVTQVSKRTNAQRVSRLAPLLLGLAVCASLPVAAAPSEVPDHARANRYGSIQIAVCRHDDGHA